MRSEAVRGTGKTRQHTSQPSRAERANAEATHSHSSMYMCAYACIFGIKLLSGRSSLREGSLCGGFSSLEKTSHTQNRTMPRFT
jgi:hypothetical protein